MQFCVRVMNGETENGVFTTTQPTVGSTPTASRFYYYVNAKARMTEKHDNKSHAASCKQIFAYIGAQTQDD